MVAKDVHLAFQADAIMRQAESVREKAEKMSAMCRELEAKCSSLAALYGGISDAQAAPDTAVTEAIDDLYYGLRVAVHDTYEALTTPQTFGLQRPTSVAAITEFRQYNDSIEQIHCCVKDDKLLVRTPLLWSRGRYRAWVDKHRVDYDYLHWFARSLDAALTMIGDEIPVYTVKNLSYLFVLSPDKSREKNASQTATDSDNYDTKIISDVIVSHTLGGDSARNCSFAYASLFTEELPQGTYIIVSEGIDISVSLERQKLLWKAAIKQDKKR